MMRGSGGRRFLAICATLTVIASAAQASLVRPVDLEEMTASAARVLAGHVVRVVVIDDPTAGGTITVVTLAITDIAKGPEGSTTTFRLRGDRREGSLDPMARWSTFREGEEVVLFLYAESGAGLTNTVGMGQGKFRVTADAAGRRVAVRAAGAPLTPRGESPVRARGLGPEALLNEVRRLLSPADDKEVGQ